MKDPLHFSRPNERRYPVLTAIDLVLHYLLSLTAIVLTVIALGTALTTVLPPGTLRIPGF